MDSMSLFLSCIVLGGIILRIIAKRERAGGRGPAAPAHFLYFTGRRLATDRRIHAYSSEE